MSPPFLQYCRNNLKSAEAATPIAAISETSATIATTAAKAVAGQTVEIARKDRFGRGVAYSGRNGIAFGDDRRFARIIRYA